MMYLERLTKSHTWNRPRGGSGGVKDGCACSAATRAASFALMSSRTACGGSSNEDGIVEARGGVRVGGGRDEALRLWGETD